MRNFNIFRIHTHFCHMEFVIYDLLPKTKYSERNKKRLWCGETKKELTSISSSDCENWQGFTPIYYLLWIVFIYKNWKRSRNIIRFLTYWALWTEKCFRQYSAVLKGLLNGFPCRIVWSMHAGCCEIFGKRKKHEPQAASVFLRFPKSSNIPSAWITLSCTENHLVVVL